MKRRCSICGVDWPDKAHYSPCPECHGKTYRYDSDDHLPEDEAQSRWNHARFRDYEEENPGDWTRLPMSHRIEVGEFSEKVDRYKQEAAGLQALSRSDTVEPRREIR